MPNSHVLSTHQCARSKCALALNLHCTAATVVSSLYPSPPCRSIACKSIAAGHSAVCGVATRQSQRTPRIEGLRITQTPPETERDGRGILPIRLAGLSRAGVIHKQQYKAPVHPLISPFSLHPPSIHNHPHSSARSFVRSSLSQSTRS